MSGTLRSVGGSSQPLACLSCRRLKVKCRGGDAGGCRRCANAGIECVMPTYDERKRPSSKSHIHHLEQRILQLEEELNASRAQSQTQRSISGSRSRSGSWIDDDDSLDTGDILSPQTPPPDGNGPPVSTLLAQLFSPQHRLVDNDSGRAHYLGATASLHLSRQLEPLQPASLMRVNSESMEEPTAGLYEELINIFWRDHNSVLPIACREAFMSAMVNGLSLYYSKALFYAMCTCAAFITDSATLSHLSGSSNMTAETICSSLMRNTSQLLRKETSSPQITTVQALHLLALCELMQGNITRGWLLSGNACRLLYDLGLHRVNEDISSPLGPELHLQTCQLVCWGSMVLDRLSSAYLGRPYSVNMSNIKLPRPHSLLTTSPDMQIFGALIEMSQLSGLVQDFLDDAENSKETVEEIGNHLARWHSSLPLALQYNLDGSFEVAMLHLHYYSAVMNLYRPYAGLGEPLSTLQSPTSTRSFNFRSKCMHSATMIARILDASSEVSAKTRNMTIFCLNTISIAASFLIADLANQKETNIYDPQFQQEEIWALGRCLESISVLRGTRMPAPQIYKLLQHLAWLFNVDSVLPTMDEFLPSSSKNEIASTLFPNTLPAHPVTGTQNSKTQPQHVISIEGTNIDKSYAAYDLLHDEFFHMLTGTASPASFG